MTTTANLLRDIPTAIPEEIVQVLASGSNVRIERILSKGHSSPPDFWYDQEQHEWVLLVAGEARLRFERDDHVLHLKPGDYVNIAAHEKHRVEWTTESTETIWLAVFYSA